MSDDPHGYELRMPFVCCASEGGHLDDRAFVEGVRFGHAHRELVADRPETLDHFIDPDMERQYDLLAMDNGYAVTFHDTEDPAWMLAKFVRGES